MARTFGEKDGCEEIVAIVVPTANYASNFTDKDNLETAIKNEIKYLSSQLAPYKRPIKIIVRTENLPRTTTRKIKTRRNKKITL